MASFANLSSLIELICCLFKLF
uniref:Uncharacterized protein n=1 Tax=Arundo donax TaxID=35708 RepID=A0A0A8ZGF6_ARUDO